MRSNLQQFESEVYFGINGLNAPSDDRLGSWLSLKMASPHYGLFFLNEQSGQWKYVVDESIKTVQELSDDDWIYDQLCLDESIAKEGAGRHRITVMLDQTTPHCVWLGKLPPCVIADTLLDTVFCSGDFSTQMLGGDSDGFWTIVDYPVGGHFYLNQRGQWHFDCHWHDAPPTDPFVAQVAFSDEHGRTRLGGVRFNWVDCGPTKGLKPVVWMENVESGFRGHLFENHPLNHGNVLTSVGGEDLYCAAGGWSQWVSLDGGIAMFRENGAFIAIGDDTLVSFEYTDIDGCEEDRTVVVTKECDGAFQHWYDEEDALDWQAITDSADIAFTDDAMGEPFSDCVFDNDEEFVDLEYKPSANDDRRFDS